MGFKAHSRSCSLMKCMLELGEEMHSEIPHVSVSPSEREEHLLA